jgi:hypothetical protein
MNIYVTAPAVMTPSTPGVPLLPELAVLCQHWHSDYAKIRPTEPEQTFCSQSVLQLFVSSFVKGPMESSVVFT